MTVRESVLDTVCEQRDRLPLVIGVAIVMGVLLAFSFLFLDPGTAAFAIALLDAILVGGSLLVFGTTYWYCTKRAMDD